MLTTFELIFAVKAPRQREQSSKSSTFFHMPYSETSSCPVHQKMLAILIFGNNPSDFFLQSEQIGTKLDFIHLDINKKQGKLRQTLRQEVADANPANRIYHDT